MRGSTSKAAETAALLKEFGIELAACGVVMTDLAKAKSANVVHARLLPVAVVAMTLASPTLARERFPKLRLVEVVAKAPSMDGREQRALARVCGDYIDSPLLEGAGRVSAFAAHLVDVLDRYSLGFFFTRDPAYAVNPRGVERNGEVDKDSIADCRAAFKFLDSVQKMMVATIVCLYGGTPDKTWLARLPRISWLAVEAVAALQEAGALRDWGRVVALYPGW
jgi:hypothetical protein